MHPLIQEERADIAALCQRYDSRHLEDFGSAARGDDFDPATGVADFVVEFDPQRLLPPLEEFFGFQAELSRLLERPVALVETRAVLQPVSAGQHQPHAGVGVCKWFGPPVLPPTANSHFPTLGSKAMCNTATAPASPPRTSCNGSRSTTCCNVHVVRLGACAWSRPSSPAAGCPHRRRVWNRDHRRYRRRGPRVGGYPHEHRRHGPHGHTKTAHNPHREPLAAR